MYYFNLSVYDMITNKIFDETPKTRQTVKEGERLIYHDKNFYGEHVPRKFVLVFFLL